MSIENSAIHYIKDTMFGDFYLNNPLENKPLGRIFCQMVEFKSLENITYLSPTSVFMQDMLEAFVEFDKNLNPPGLITKQFTALAQKCKEKGVKLLIGKDYRNNNIGVDRTKLHQDNVFINFNENMVKNMMKNPIYVIQQKGNNIPEIKAIPLGNLVAGTMVTDFDNPALIAKCAAYLLFHELFHVNTFVEYSQWENGKQNDLNVKHCQIQGIDEETIKTLLANDFRYDDFRNVTGATKEHETRVPGEFELLKALYAHKPTMRLYEGEALNFKTDATRTACLNVFKTVFKESLTNDINPLLLYKEGYLLNTELIQKHIYLKIVDLDVNIFKLEKKVKENLKKEIVSSQGIIEKKLKYINSILEQIKNDHSETIETTKSTDNIIKQIQEEAERLKNLSGSLEEILSSLQEKIINDQLISNDTKDCLGIMFNRLCMNFYDSQKVDNAIDEVKKVLKAPLANNKQLCFEDEIMLLAEILIQVIDIINFEGNLDSKDVNSFVNKAPVAASSNIRIVNVLPEESKNVNREELQEKFKWELNYNIVQH